MEHDVTSLGNDLRRVAHHILLAVDTRIDGQLADTGGTGSHLPCLANTLDGHIIGTDDHPACATILKSTAPINITNNDFRGGDHDAITITVEQTAAELVEHLRFELLYFGLLLLDLCQVFFHTILECLQHCFPFIEYIAHNLIL